MGELQKSAERVDTDLAVNTIRLAKLAGFKQALEAFDAVKRRTTEGASQKEEVD